jgi:ABC-type nitrate/sulfonate/bicarbonate transport system ATPase subunit
MTGLARDANRTVIFQTPAGTPLMSIITVTKLQKSFGATTVLRSFDLGLEQGEFLSLPGPSGCGKITVLRLLAGFETPAAGDIHIDGQSVMRQRLNQRRVVRETQTAGCRMSCGTAGRHR